MKWQDKICVFATGTVLLIALFAWVGIRSEWHRVVARKLGLASVHTVDSRLKRDEVAEELFALAADVGVAQIKVVISPWDFRMREVSVAPASKPAWLPDLYDSIQQELAKLPRAPPRTPTN